jgi:hypothetical protein
MHLRRTLLTLPLTLLTACGDDGNDGAPQPVAEPAMLGERCSTDSDCLSGLCLTSQYGTPFCTRACERPFEACDGGPDLPADRQALCLDFTTTPNPNAPAFQGEIKTFCAPRCASGDTCDALDPIWETCDIPRWLGDPLYPLLGNQRVCQSPSFHGKEPVDPTACDWDRTVESRFANEANLCRSYCRYLWACKELPSGASEDCCGWGCYNAMVLDGEVQTTWRDEVRCYLDTHAAYPDTGPRNRCTEPPAACGGAPTDPTPAAAKR